MIAICIIVTVIGSFICTLIKVKIAEWLDVPSMKRFRLSLNRHHHSPAADATIETVDISDDDSFDSSSGPRENVQREKNSSITSGTTDVSNDTLRAPNLEACTANTSQQQQMPDLSDDASSDEDVIVIKELPSEKISNGSQSMFDWSKTSFNNTWLQNGLSLEDDTPHGSRLDNPEEARVKRQKVMDDTSLSDNSDDLEDSEKEASPSRVMIQREKMIGGIKVKFPVDPYTCQIGIVYSIIQGCNRRENCLLESPTGSGKTLALLCGVLAWQDYYGGEILKENNGKNTESSSCAEDDSLGENFFLNLSQYCNEESFSDEDVNNHRPARVPKVFYGTRTHKQIEQVVRELKKTAYRDKRMTILSSREHSCIQNTTRSKTELCNELLDPKKPKRCPYYTEKNKKNISSFNALEKYGLETPWDIEDLVSLGRNISTCPYFAARSLMAEAEIIFCPYNYILDPNIRESMQISLRDNIVILDEAHNVEDICREVASVDLRDEELNNAAKECRKLSYDRRDGDKYNTLHNYLDDIEKFLNTIDVQDDGDLRQMASEYFDGSRFLEMLNVNAVGSSRFPGFLAASKAAILDLEKMKDEVRPEYMLPTISRETKTILEHLCFIMQILTSEASVDDYKAHVVETEEFKKNMSANTWISKNCKVRIMKLICMNPAIVFAPLAHTVRSVILASGTLTPMSSFESELGTKFRYRPKLKHVVTKEQMYVRCVPRGPNKKPLSAKYTTVNSFDFQDELGALVLQVTKAVPYGVLCFFSSYNVMKKILTRWRDTKIWEKISELKEIFEEPQMNSDLPAVMYRYREVIEQSSSKSFRIPSGAILFAVFRGKVAEGIDFRDNEARCVLAVGIPYKQWNCASVRMKRDYNDSNQSKGLLKGSEWYTVNAFRALNQALGRCIRHKDDWGAVLLVDERFRQEYNTNYLPHWVKSMWLPNDNYDLPAELQDFVALQVARERGKEQRP